MPGYSADLETLMRGIKSPTMQTQVNYFFKNGGTVKYDSSTHSHYVPEPLSNGISAPGVIHINAADITSTAARLGVPANVVAKAMVIHEMGHAFYATADASAYRNSPEGKIAWCVNREAEAAAFAFKVGKELLGPDVGSFTVLGPPSKPDLYADLASAVAGLNPASSAYEKALLEAGRAIYGGDGAYMSYCTKWAVGGGLPPSFIVPADPDYPGAIGGGGHSGGGGGGGGGSVKIPGGYWQEPEIPQHPSDFTAPQPEAEVDVALLSLSELWQDELFSENSPAASKISEAIIPEALQDLISADSGAPSAAGRNDQINIDSVIVTDEVASIIVVGLQHKSDIFASE